MGYEKGVIVILIVGSKLVGYLPFLRGFSTNCIFYRLFGEKTAFFETESVVKVLTYNKAKLR
jgi:hypothetical protein